MNAGSNYDIIVVVKFGYMRERPVRSCAYSAFYLEESVKIVQLVLSSTEERHGIIRRKDSCLFRGVTIWENKNG